MRVPVKKGRRVVKVEVLHDQRGDWMISFNRYRAVWPATVDEWEAWRGRIPGFEREPVTPLPARIDKMIREVVKPKRWNTTESKPVPVMSSAWAPLDGEEAVTTFPLKTVAGLTVAANVRCTSPRCEWTDDSGQRQWWVRTVIASPGRTGSDPRMGTYRVFTPPGPVIEGQYPDDVAHDHRMWHRANWPEHSRVTLNRWIDRHRNVAPPALSDADRAELDRQLSIARAEQSAQAT